MPDPLPQLELTPKKIEFKPEQKQKLTNWLTGQKETMSRVVAEDKQDLSEEVAKRNEKPRNILKRFARLLEDDITQGIRDRLRNNGHQLQDINAALLEVRNGKVDRVDRLLRFELEQSKQLLSMRLSAEDDLPGFRDVPRRSYESSLKAIEVLEIINPDAAKRYKSWFETTGQRAISW